MCMNTHCSVSLLQIKVKTEQLHYDHYMLCQAYTASYIIIICDTHVCVRPSVALYI